MYVLCISAVCDPARRVYASIGEQQGVLTEWQETTLVDLSDSSTSSPLGSCCNAGP